MKLEEQVVSLKLAKRLKELGVKQLSIFYWDVDYPNGIDFDFENASICIRQSHAFLRDDEGIPVSILQAGLFSAFTVAELGEILPHNIYTWHKDGDWYCSLPNDEDCLDSSKEKTFNYDSKEADARAKMLIHLIEQGIVKLGGKGE